MFEDEEKKRILAAIDEKIAGKQIVANEPHEPASGGAQVIDLVEALRASLGKGGAARARRGAGEGAAPTAAEPAAAKRAAKERKGVKRAAKVEEAAPRPRARGPGSDEPARPEHLHDPRASRRCWASRAASSPA